MSQLEVLHFSAIKVSYIDIDCKYIYTDFVYILYTDVFYTLL